MAVFAKICDKTFNREANFTWFCEFVYIFSPSFPEKFGEVNLFPMECEFSSNLNTSKVSFALKGTHILSN